MRRLPRVFLLSFMLLPLSACGLTGGPIGGQVLEAGSNKPIPGVIVIARWQGTYSQIVDSQTVCYHVETATTDAEGRYQIPAWKEKSKGLMFSAGPWLIDAYKTGYETYWPKGYSATEEYKKNIRYLALFKGTSGERLEELRRLNEATRCPGAGESRKKALIFEKAIYEEARSLAVTPADKDIVNNLLFDIESEEVGSMEALKRMDARKRGTK